MLIKENHKEAFEKLILEHDDFAILPHYNPDPDSLGAAFAAHFILNKCFNKKSKIYVGGMIGRAENKMMIDILDIPLEYLDDGQVPDGPILLMDTQPGTGNNPLTKESKPLMVFDHHPLKRTSSSIKFGDIRIDYGSTCTIMYDYLKKFELKPTVNVATALYYGIQTDVVGEGRTGNKIDFNSLEELSRFINREKLYSIENPKLPFDYYIHVNKGFENSVMYDDLLISSLGEIENPDYIGEIADLLIRFNKCYLVLIMGIYKNSIQLSFRSQRKKVDAGLVLRKIVGNMGAAGGHTSNSGGRILFEKGEDIPKISKKIITKTLQVLKGKITTGIPFLSLGDYFNY